MTELELAGLKVHLNKSALADSGSMKAAVVLLHGFGAPGTDLLSLADVLPVPEGTGLFFPEGPLDLGQVLGRSYSGARAWWPIDMVQLQVAMMTGQVARAAEGLANGLERARDQVIILLNELQERFGIDSNRIVLGGFSQGAVASLDVALRDSRKLAGLLLMSGTMTNPDAVAELAAERVNLPIMLSHGRSDPVLPYSVAEALRDKLINAGCQVTWVPFDGGHGIPRDVQLAAATLLPKWLG